MKSPLVTEDIDRLLKSGASRVECSLDLGRSLTSVEITATSWSIDGVAYPYLDRCKERTIYYWDGDGFEPVARYSQSLIKLVPTQWGTPTFEIDGIKMLPSAQISPFDDAHNKVQLIQPTGKIILDTCGGLGYFAAWCKTLNARRIISFEKNPDVVWLRGINPWSPVPDEVLSLTQGDVLDHIEGLTNTSVDAILHDPPRFGIAGDLYSQYFYDQLARVLKPKGRLFHYTGTPNKLTSGRNVPDEVARRLRHAGFSTERIGDGVLAIKK